MWRLTLLFTLLLQAGPSPAQAQDCIPSAERRDCFPWPGASPELCAARGCTWCEGEPGAPFCYYDDKACPSEVADGDRVDCLPEGGGKDDCTSRGCVWCESQTPGVPWCFADDSVSLGGDACPADVGYSVGELVDCWPGPEDVTREQCLAKGCYWCPGELDAEPWCYTPKEYGYRMVGEPVQTPQGFEVNIRRVNYPSWFGNEIEEVKVEVELQSNERVRIKLSDPRESRFEVPVPIDPPQSDNDDPLYDVQFTDSPAFAVKVIRRSTGATIFDSSIGGLTLSDQFLQIGTYLDSPHVYGFGEHEHPSLRHSVQWKKWGMWTRDQAVTASNLYGQQPFYLNVEQSGAAHGVLFLNANAQDVVLQPEPALLFRTTGGVLDIYVFVGPEPEEVIQQYTQAVGRPVMVPYWALGFQLCRWGYKSLGEMQEAIARMRQYDIPHDIQYGDIDYMRDYLDFTIDEDAFGGLAEYVDQLKAEGTRYVIILDPGISYTQAPGSYPTFDRGEDLDVWIKDSSGSAPATGYVWPGATYFPDFTKPATEDWWVTECVLFKDQLDYAALWIDMNEPSNFTDIDDDPSRCPNNRWNRPPFMPAIDGLLYDKTLCMESVQEAGLFYNVHSLYGYSMSKQSFPAAREATGQRSVVFSRSTFPGTGRYAQHWLGDNFSNWSSLKNSIIGMLEFNFFGMPYTGADICGFIGVTTEELCLRWQQLGAFYPFSRNHNADGEPAQDPGMWPSVAVAARDALHIRYRLLPYLYTQFFQVHTEGGTVVKPLFFEFPSDEAALGLDEQFLWGDAVLVSPVVYEGARSVDAYFPEGRWYDYATGAETPGGGTVTLPAPLDTVPVHFRGGFVLPTQRPSNSTLFSRSLPLGLVAALDADGEARGQLFWDDGDSIETISNKEYFLGKYDVSEGSLTGRVEEDGFPGVSALTIDDIEVLGLTEDVTAVTIDGEDFQDWTYDSTNRKLTLQNAGISANSDFVVSWA